jgi:FAD/FMN-containing dehydrogenase
MTELPESKIAELRARIRGEVLTPRDAAYDATRRIWNAMIDRRPALTARCTSADDVRQAVEFARSSRLLVSIRGGGHNIAGNAVCDDGLMIDLSLMKRVRVDPEARRAMVEAGCTLADVDAATQAHGLATPLGVNSTTGVAGLTLGGGFGWLSRKYGMTVDNLVSADVVLADGREVHASTGDYSDLFWGLRGGGGNFGIVTQFEFRLHPVGPDVLTGLIVYPFDQAKEHIGVQPYTAWQQVFDPLLTPGARNYWKSHNFLNLNDEVIDLIIDSASRLPSPQSEIFVGTIGGQTRRVAPEAMAYSSRDAAYVLNVHGRWTSPAEDERGTAWARDFFARSRPFASGGAYINFLTQEEADRVAFAYGDAYTRLRELKTRYDPTNFFRMNQNIPPA